MGYSVLVKFKSIKDRDEAFDLLLTHQRLWLDEYDFATMVRGPVLDPSYDGDLKKILGFDFGSSGDPASQIAYYLCYWIANKYNAQTYYDGVDKIQMPNELKEMIGWNWNAAELWSKISQIYKTLEKGLPK